MYVGSAASGSPANAGTSALSLSASQITSTDSAFAAMLNGGDDSSAESMLADMTKNGINSFMAWRVKQMQEKIAGQVMGNMGLTPAKIAAMPATQRVAVEQLIMQQVAQQLKQQITEEMKRQNPDTFGLGMMDSSGAALGSSGSVNITA